MRLYYDRSRDRARASIEQADALLRAYNREWGRGRLVLRGVAPEVAAPLDIEMHDFATPQSSRRASCSSWSPFTACSPR